MALYVIGWMIKSKGEKVLDKEDWKPENWAGRYFIILGMQKGRKMPPEATEAVEKGITDLANQYKLGYTPMEIPNTAWVLYTHRYDGPPIWYRPADDERTWTVPSEVQSWVQEGVKKVNLFESRMDSTWLASFEKVREAAAASTVAAVSTAAAYTEDDDIGSV